MACQNLRIMSREAIQQKFTNHVLMSPRLNNLRLTAPHAAWLAAPVIF